MLQVCTDQTNKNETRLLDSGSGGWTLATGGQSGCHRLLQSPKHYQIRVTDLARSVLVIIKLVAITFFF